MGYRSDVVYAFYTPIKDAGRAAFIRAWCIEKKLTSIASDWGEEGRFIPEVGMLFSFESVKWYDDYEDVKVFMHAFREFWDAFCDDLPARKNIIPADYPASVEYACEYVRIGEESQDIEELRSSESEYRVQLSRAIRLDF